jgi:hypothetical protein
LNASSAALPLLLLQARQEQGKPAFEFGSAQEQELLAWVLLWWKYPAAMRAVRKVSTVDPLSGQLCNMPLENELKLCVGGQLVHLASANV